MDFTYTVYMYTSPTATLSLFDTFLVIVYSFSDDPIAIVDRPAPIMLFKLPIMLLSNVPKYSLLCPNYAPLCPIMLHCAHLIHSLSLKILFK